ncbi:MAG: alpha/beta fold hydrolase [Spirochaetes bacterium]|nr:alpha/beta fold hydrolase [Spirochaetota bacterium]
MEIMKGWEPYSYKRASRIGVLVLHGYTGSTSSARPLGDYLGRYYNVESPRLTGHGTRWQDLNKLSYKDWINDVETALVKLKKRAKRIFVAGLSVGGELSLYLAEHHPELLGVIIVNHLLIVHNPLLPFLPVLKHLVPSVPAVGNDIKDTSQTEIGYKCTPLKGLAEVMRLADVVKKDLPKVTQPVLIFKSKEDHVVPAVNATYTYERISSADKEIVWLTNSYHVATMDFDKDIINKKTHEFIRKHS